MNFFTTLTCICLIVYFCLYVGLKFYPQLKRKELSDLVQIEFLFGTIFVGSGVLCILSLLPLSLFFVLNTGGLLAIIIQHAPFSLKLKLLLSFCLCLCSTLCLYPSTEHFLLMPVVLTLFWGITWGIFVLFDCCSFVSYIVSLCWGIAIVAVGLVMRTIPQMIIAQTALLTVSITVFSCVRFSQKKTNLGKTVASLMGFIWGGILTYFVNSGAVLQTFILFGYYFFEGIILLGLFLTRKNMVTLLEHLLNVPQVRSKAMGIIFSHLLILSFLSSMTMSVRGDIVPALIFVLVVVLMDLYLRLSTLETPMPTWRELFKSTFQGITDFTKQIKQNVPVSKKTTSSKKKTPKRTVRKK